MSFYMLSDTHSLSCQCSPVDPPISLVSSFLIDSSTRQILCRSQPPGSLLHQRGARGPGRSPGSAIKSSVANLQRSSLRADDTYAPQKWVQCAKCEQWRKVRASPCIAKLSHIHKDHTTGDCLVSLARNISALSVLGSAVC